jgi:hypothetical protein
VSAAFLILLLLPVARFVLEAVVVLVVLATGDKSRREAALAVLPMVRSARARATGSQQGADGGVSPPES